MTLQTARNAISSTSPKKTKAEGQAILESMVGISKEMLGGTGDFATTKSLATDILTIGNDNMLYVVQSESSTTDDFKTIAFSPSGDIRDGFVVGVKPLTGHTLTAKPPVSGAKRIITRTGRDLVMDADHYTWFKFDAAADAWQQILPDWTALLEFIAGVRAASTLTIGSSVVTGDRAFHIIAGASALNLQAILGNYQDGNVVYIKTDNAFVYTLKHNVAVTGKLNLLTAADITMSVGAWYAFVKNGTQWDHLWTSSSVAVAASTVGTIGEIALGDGLGGWKKTGAAIAKGSLIVGASASALGVLAAGTNGQVVTYDSAEALGVKAATPSAGGSGRVNNYRLSVSSSDPEPSNTTGASTVYLKEYNGDALDIYNGSTWSSYTALSLSIAVPSTQYFRIYDVFADYNSGTPQLAVTAWDSGGQSTKAITLLTIANPCVITCTAHGWNVGDKIGIRKGTAAGTAWTDTAMGLDQKEFYISAKTTNTLTLEGCDTSALAVTNYTGATAYLIPASRTTAIVRQNGTWCQSGTLTKRLLGTFMTNGAGTVDDTSSARMLSNAENLVLAKLASEEVSASYTTPAVAAYTPRSNSLELGVTRSKIVNCLPANAVIFLSDSAEVGTTGSAALGINRCPNGLTKSTWQSILTAVVHCGYYNYSSSIQVPVSFSAGFSFLQHFNWADGTAYAGKNNGTISSRAAVSVNSLR